MQHASVAEAVKEQVVDNVPKRIRELKFGILSNQDIVNQGVLEVCDRNLYDLARDRAIQSNGPLDPRMGISSKDGFCKTCGETLQQCNGHFGYVKLALPALHIGYLRLTIAILQDICKECGRILLPEPERRKYLRELRRARDNLHRTQICKRINVLCRKSHRCFYCGSLNGAVKKVGQHPLKIIHERFSRYNNSKAEKRVEPGEKVIFERSFEEARKIHLEVDRHIKKAVDDLNPLRVLSLFKLIPNEDCELLGMIPTEGRPEMFIWQYIPAPPVCIRPSVKQDLASTEDDVTSKLSDIVHVNNLIKEGLQSGQPVQTIMEQWDFLQIQIAIYINSDVPGIPTPTYGKAIRGFCQRLKGKQGRFRGNLSGKRVDFSGRTVISPDPNLAIDEVAVPQLVAKDLTYPEQVSRYNIDKLRVRVRNGANKWPGANYVTKKEQGIKQFLRYGSLSQHAENLQIGDIVERHLEDGDIVLFNRQPSLHKLSILSHYVKVRPSRTFRLNECVCNPYNADFDGDEMNLHVPQTEEAKAEANELMGVKHNLVTPKNGEPIISAIQDFITAAYLLSSKDNFFDRKTFTNLCMSMAGANMQLDLPPPAVLKPVALWTGKQVFNIMMRPNKASPVLVNLDAMGREYRVVPGQPRDLDKNDSWLCVRNSEVMCGVMDKSTIGSGKKDSVFYVILRDFGPGPAVEAMGRLAKLAARWLTNQGFSIGINDVYPGPKLTASKTKLIETAYAECDALIARFKDGKLERHQGMDDESTLETDISHILSKVRKQAGDLCLAELSRWNSPLIMAACGSKGSDINVSQMVAVVGQQIIGGERVADGFQDRSLPHFPKNARQPPSKGFVRNSFFTGLSPSEFLFHAISGREGLVDTAVKTAETGYMSRRLMKSLEDLSTQYDSTVRNSASHIVQFQYGDDNLDPVDMEGKAKPVHFERTFTYAEATTWNNDEPSLLPWEIIATCNDLLSPERLKYCRLSACGNPIEYLDQSDAGVDQKESGREFLKSIEDFVHRKADELAAARKRLGLSAGFEKREVSRRKNPVAVSKVKSATDATDRVAKLSRATLTAFIKACLHKYGRAITEPGHAVGAVGAQSIGEPGTQMTLKTFHFAGVAGMSLTQGVPRIKEIINASKAISTPLITCELHDPQNITQAKVAKGRIEKTYIKDVVHYIETGCNAAQMYINLCVDYETIKKLDLEITTADIATALVKQKKLKLNANHMRVWQNFIRIQVQPLTEKGSRVTKPATAAAKKEATEIYLRTQAIKRFLPDIAIRGYPHVTRAVIKSDEKDKSHKLYVEGYGLHACMTTDGINGLRTTTNSVAEIAAVLGIEAARTTIVKEIRIVMGDMDIDPRHMQLLADVMTYKGEILGITRFGLAKMRDSVLQLASFEKTPDHLFEAAAKMKTDRIEGVSECIILGQSMKLGTGGFQVVRGLDLQQQHGVVGKKDCLFEDLWERRKG